MGCFKRDSSIIDNLFEQFYRSLTYTPIGLTRRLLASAVARCLNLLVVLC